MPGRLYGIGSTLHSNGCLFQRHTAADLYARSANKMWSCAVEITFYIFFKGGAVVICHSHTYLSYFITESEDLSFTCSAIVECAKENMRFMGQILMDNGNEKPKEQRITQKVAGLITSWPKWEF